MGGIMTRTGKLGPPDGCGPWAALDEAVSNLPERALLPPNPKQAFGDTKPNLALVPPVADLHMAMAFEHGAAKYGAYNWRVTAVEAMTYVAAAKRHLGDWVDGVEMTHDGRGLVHNLGAVMACCAIVLDALEQGNLIDNRPPRGASEAVALRIQARKKALAK